MDKRLAQCIENNLKFTSDEDIAQRFFHYSDMNIYNEGLEVGFNFGKQIFSLFDIDINEEHLAILNERIAIKGAKHQKIKTIEELSELIKELAKDVIDSPNASEEKIIDEYADVILMMVQLKKIYSYIDNFSGKVQNVIDSKIIRLDLRNKKIR